MSTLILSRWPVGMSGIFSAANRGFFTSVKVRFGETSVIMYGPTPGGGSFERFFAGVPAGTSPAEGNAITFANAPYGWVRWMVILPVESSVWMPEIVLLLPVSYADAPSM